MSIDIHTHFLPKSWPSFKDKFGYSGFIDNVARADGSGRDLYFDDGRFFRKLDPNVYDTEVRIQEMIELGIDQQLLSTVPAMFSYWAPAQDALHVAQFFNDHIAETCATHSQKFLGLGQVPLQDIDLAIRELRRCREDLGLSGVQIGSHYNEHNLGDPYFERFWEAARDLNVAVLVHPWDMLGRDRMQRYWLPWLVGMPTETCLAISSMLFAGIFVRFAGLKVCFAHGGGSLVGTIGRIQHGFESRPDLCAVDCAVSPLEQMGRFYCDSVTHDPNILKLLIDLIGVDRVMMGSDYPFPLGVANPVSAVSQIGLTKIDIEKLTHQNALTWLGVSV